jgi:sec-independent protein translocase protein TatC
MSESDTIADDKSGSLMSHLVELRDRVVRMMLAILVIFLSLFYWANEIYIYLAEPLTKHLPEGSNMIAIDVASPFLTPFKLVLMLSVFLAMPVILHQLWAFVAPGLYKSEKRLAAPLLASSIILFYLGMAFAYYVVFPLVFGFFTSIGPEMVAISTDIGRYLDFVLALFFGFGLAFEVPIATIILVAIGVTTPKKLSEMRPYVIVGAFVLGMILTPPDVISQVLLAVPVWILFEGGVIASAILFRERLAQEEADDLAFAEDDDDDDDNPTDKDEYQPLSDEEMEAELDKAEAEESIDDKGKS